VNNLTQSSPASDDTVEFQLSEDELHRLSQAAEAAQPPTIDKLPAVMPPKKPVVRLRGAVVQPSRPRPRKTILGWAGAAAVYAAFMAFAWWGVAAIPVQQTSQATGTKIPITTIHRVATPIGSPPAMVQVRNPFDATEVFEFPAGTSDEESRAKVAELLLQRARTRHAQWAHIKPKANLRMAKN
jgi:hypothetical protein